MSLASELQWLRAKFARDASEIQRHAAERDDHTDCPICDRWAAVVQVTRGAYDTRDDPEARRGDGR